MTSRSSIILGAAAGVASLLALAATPAAALSSAECSALYKAAQQAKSLNGQTWNDFQKTKCADAPAAAATATTPAPAAKAAETKPADKPVTTAQATTPAPAASTAAAAPAAKGLTSKECSLKYKEAKAANTLNGQKWKDFQKAQCGPGASAPVGKVDTATAAATAAASTATFPSAVAAKYASEKPGKARMHTCLDQYKANKATNANGGLKWIQRTGGGYYSECNKRLKAKS